MADANSLAADSYRVEHYSGAAYRNVVCADITGLNGQVTLLGTTLPN